LTYEELIELGVKLRAGIAPVEWFFDMYSTLYTLPPDIVIDPGCKSSTNVLIIFLKWLPSDPFSIFEAAHEIAHWYLRLLGYNNHTDGDANIVAAQLIFPRIWFELDDARLRLSLCEMMPAAMLAAWGESILSEDDLRRVLPTHILVHPDVMYRMNKERRVETRRILSVFGRNGACRDIILDPDEPDASRLLPELASVDELDAVPPSRKRG
jgi:hypothetical protein